MRNKTRKFIWSAPLVAALAIIGALTLAGVLLLPNANTADAQGAAPGVPTIVSVTPGAIDLDVVFAAPSHTGAGIDGYEFQYVASDSAPTSTTTWTNVAGADDDDASSGATFFNVATGLSDTPFYVRIRANGTPNGEYSAANGPHSLVPDTKPAAPQMLTVTSTGATVLRASWSPPPDDGGDPIATYVVFVDGTRVAEANLACFAADGTTTADTSGNGNCAAAARHADITGLETGVEVTVGVVASNGVNAGDDNPAEAKGTAGKSSGELDSSSDSASATVKLTLEISLLSDLTGSSWVEIYLENDYQEPSSISKSSVIFEVTGAPTTGTATATPNTAFAAAEVELDDGGEIAGEEDAVVISARVPDMNPSDDATGYPLAGQTLTVVVEKSANVKNPSEKGSHSTGFSIIRGTDDRAGEAGTKLTDLVTKAKVSLSDEDNSRGYELTVTGSGFKNGKSAGVFVYHTDGPEPTDCVMVRALGTEVGSGTVGSDDKVSVTFEVTVPTFGPGTDADGAGLNYVCMIDGAGTQSSDIDQFELQPSISISPETANVGDTVTVFAQDFMANDPVTLGLALARVPSSHPDLGFPTSGGGIGGDGSGSATFVVPGWAEGTLRLDAWGEDTDITIIGSSLIISKSEALPNELITITGDGFSTGSGNHVDAARVTIDSVPLEVHEDSLNGNGAIDVSSSGQFVATVVLWPAQDGTNPTLTAGVHTIKVEDNNGFSGTAIITIPEPTVTLTPNIAGPRDVITISGENWPVDNVEGSTPPTVNIAVDDGRPRSYSALPDSAGRWFVEHRVAGAVAIPSTNRVTASVGTEIVKLATFEVPAAIIEVSPGDGQPGDTVTLSVDKMPLYAAVDSIQIAGRDVLPVGNFSTDRTGSVTVDGVVIPGLDPGVYSVLMDIDDTVAIGAVEVLAEVVGTDTPTADALAPLGDSLSAAFHFDNVSKSWSFHDPRPEFADLNTLSSLVNGEAYWVLVSSDVDDVVLNNKSRSLTCSGGDCWNLVIW